MVQEDKQLLLKDLCGRLPYGVKIRTWYNDTITSDINTFPYGIDETPYEQLSECKPYLRPMSSMTEEELELLKKYSGLEYGELDLAEFPNSHKCLDFYLSEVPSYTVIQVFDWLNAHHFDYRLLIEKGLALESPKDMYKTE